MEPEKKKIYELEIKRTSDGLVRVLAASEQEAIEIFGRATLYEVDQVFDPIETYYDVTGIGDIVDADDEAGADLK